MTNLTQAGSMEIAQIERERMMTDTDTVDRVAEAICDANTYQGCWRNPYTLETTREAHRALARAAIAALPPVTPQEAAKVLLNDTTIADKVEMNHAGVAAMFPGGWEASQKIAFDKGRIAALRALTNTQETEGE